MKEKVVIVKWKMGDAATPSADNAVRICRVDFPIEFTAYLDDAQIEAAGRREFAIMLHAVGILHYTVESMEVKEAAATAA